MSVSNGLLSLLNQGHVTLNKRKEKSSTQYATTWIESSDSPTKELSHSCYITNLQTKLSRASRILLIGFVWHQYNITKTYILQLRPSLANQILPEHECNLLGYFITRFIHIFQFTCNNLYAIYSFNRTLAY